MSSSLTSSSFAFVSVVSAMIRTSLGQFYRYVAFVFITGRRRDDDVQIPPVEEVKETRIHSASLNAKRASKREKKEHL